MQKQKALIAIGKNDTYKQVCKSLDPKNWDEIYSMFLLIVCEKPKEYFDSDLDYKCKALIRALTLPCSEVNYKPKKSIQTVFIDQIENISHSSSTKNIKREALFSVYEQEENKYLKRIMGLMINGHTQSSIRRLTNNRLPTYELTRVFKIIKQKVINKHEELCKLL